MFSCFIYGIEPFGVTHIVIGYPIDLTFNLFLRNILNFFGRDTGINGPGLADGSFQYYGPGSNDGIAVDHRVIHYNGSHTDEYIVMNLATMNNGIMANGNIVANYGLCFFKGAVDHRPILDINFIAHPDAVHITPHHGVKPDTALVTHYHVAHNGGIGRNKTTFTPFGKIFFNR